MTNDLYSLQGQECGRDRRGRRHRPRHRARVRDARARTSPASISTAAPPRRPAREAAKSGPARASASRCDVGSEDDVTAAADKVLAEFKAVHVLVNGAAGHDPNGTVLDLSLDRLEPRDGGQCRRRVPDEPRVPAVDDRGRWRQHHPHRVAARQRRGARPRGLLHQQGRADPARQGDGDGSRGAERARQHALARRGRDRAAGEALRRHGNGAARRPGRSICSDGSASRTRSPQPRCFSRAMRRAS